MKNLKNDIEKCKTEKQLYKILDKYNLKVIRDDSIEVGCFSVWLDSFTRIYKPCNSKFMKLQRWSKCKFEYSGTPVFFG